MTPVRVSCETCGVVDVPQSDFRLMICRDERQSYYAFVCGTCSDEQYRPAPEPIVVKLLLADVRPFVWDVPDELLEEHTGAALTSDDLLDFAIALGSTDLLAGSS